MILWNILQKFLLSFCSDETFLLSCFVCLFWLHWVLVAACELPLVAVGRGSSPVVLHGLFTAVASLIAEHGLQARGVQ